LKIINMINISKITLPLCLVLINSHAVAFNGLDDRQLEESVAVEHWYLGAEGGIADVSEALDTHAVTTTIYAGRHLTSWLSVNMGILYNDPDYFSSDGEYTLSGLDLSLQPSYALNDEWSLFAKVGVLLYDFDTANNISDQSLSSTLGLGAEYKLDANWSMVATVNYYDQVGSLDTGEINLSSYNLGVRYQLKKEEPVVVQASPKPEGKPKPQPKPITTTNESILFDHDRSSLSNESIERLKLAWAAEKGEIKSIKVQGFASVVGNAAYNKKLSKKRAYAVADLISESFGVERDSIVVEYYGEQFYIDTDKSRRVVVTIKKQP